MKRSKKMVELKNEIVKNYGFKYREIKNVIETKTHITFIVKNNIFITEKKSKKIVFVI